VRVSPPSDLRPYLRTLDAETLADLVHAQAERDPELRHSLELRAATQSGDVSEAHRLLDTAVTDGNAEYAAKVGAVLDTLQRMLDVGSRADLAPLARRTVDDISEMYEQAGDHPGDLGDRLDRAVELYARACAARPPDPEKLADWIVEVEFDGPGRPVIDLAEFATALGEPGLRRIKSTVDDVLAASGPSHRRDVAERLQEQLAEVLGDVDGLVAILSAKPPRVDVSLKIVRVLRAAGRHSEAIAHAARALTPHKYLPPPPPPEADDDVSRRRKEFDERPDRETYAALREAAVDAGKWPVQRRAALTRLRERAAEGAEHADELARVLLEDGRPDEAWRACVRFGASSLVSLELAELRAVEHPAETIPVFRAAVDELIERKDPQAYTEAARRLKLLRTLHKRAGTPDEFTAYLAALVETHKRKTRLITEIRTARIALPKAVTSPRAAR
jgi:tetratricopeptide (TPR) repeat protein